MNKLSSNKIIVILLAATGLLVVYLFQQTDYANGLTNNSQARFIISKLVRLLLNDVFMLIIIYTLFQEKSVRRLALFIQAIDFCVLLPLYLFLKLNLEGDAEISSPLLSQLHRLIVNPTFMILLIPAVYFQRLSKK